MTGFFPERRPFSPRIRLRIRPRLRLRRRRRRPTRGNRTRTPTSRDAGARSRRRPPRREGPGKGRRRRPPTARRGRANEARTNRPNHPAVVVPENPPRGPPRVRGRRVFFFLPRAASVPASASRRVILARPLVTTPREDPLVRVAEDERARARDAAENRRAELRGETLEIRRLGSSRRVFSRPRRRKKKRVGAEKGRDAASRVERVARGRLEARPVAPTDDHAALRGHARLPERDVDPEPVRANRRARGPVGGERRPIRGSSDERRPRRVFPSRVPSRERGSLGPVRREKGLIIPKRILLLLLLLLLLIPRPGRSPPHPPRGGFRVRGLARAGRSRRRAAAAARRVGARPPPSARTRGGGGGGGERRAGLRAGQTPRDAVRAHRGEVAVPRPPRVRRVVRVARDRDDRERRVDDGGGGGV